MSVFNQLMMRKKRINATIIGNPTISNDFIVTNFSRTSYLRIPIDFMTSNTDSFKIHTKGRILNGFGTDSSRYDNLIFFDTTITGYYGIQLKINRFKKVFSSSGITDSAWIIDTEGSTTLITNAWYYINYIYIPNIGININLSSDNINWTTEISYSGNAQWITGQIPYIGYCPRLSQSYQRFDYCEIDMKEYYIEKNNQIIWQGVI